MVTFAVIAIITLLALLALDGLARHTGNPDPTDWLGLVLISAGAGAIGAGIVGVVWEISATFQGLLS